MNINEQVNQLWGGIIDSVSVDIVKHTAEFAIHIVDLVGITRYRLSFAGVADIHFVDGRVGEWAYAELTEIRTSLLIDESVKTEMVLWDEMSLLTIRSLTIALDEDDVAVDRDIANPA